MWVNITVGKIAPENVHKAIALLDRDEVRNAFRSVKGFVHDYVVESLEMPGSVQSITIWEDAKVAQEFFASPAYIQIVTGLGPLFVERPQRYSYEVRLDF
jgi:heme-degrading monooxygenase HmoA